MRFRTILFLVAALSIYSLCGGVAWWVSRTPHVVPVPVASAAEKAANPITSSGDPETASGHAGGEGSDETHNQPAHDKGSVKGNEGNAKLAAAVPAPGDSPAKKSAMLGGSPAHAAPVSQPAVPVHVQPSAATYRRLAEQNLDGKQYETAAHYYRLEGAVYRQNGDPNTAKVEETKADRWETQIGLYVDTIADRQFLEDHYTGAKFEPLYGCYLGAYAESDYSLPRLRDVSVDSPTYHEQALGTVIGKGLATAFCYCFYGDPFPVKWARALCQQGIAPQVAFEPNDGLRYVRNDAYLRQFARDAASCDGPVFLRFASEMNGNWVAYNGNPDLYKAKFRLVHDVMNQLAPNVAMIWCVYPTPENNIDDYYPGDAYVDWVGVNFFSVYHHDNDPSSPAWFENATLPLRYIYAHYAARKPIAICEYGASHREQLNMRADHTDFVAVKLAELFSALPREYPRVKLIDIFDCNNIAFAPAGRQLNDYCVTDSPAVLAAFRQAVAPGYYLSGVEQGALADRPILPRPLQAGSTLARKVRFTAWVKTYDQQPTVVYSVDGNPVAQHNTPGDYGLVLDTSRLSGTQHRVGVQVLDADGQVAGQKEVMLDFRFPTARRGRRFRT